MDTVFINNLIFWGFHGLTEKEKINAQRFIINIQIKACSIGRAEDITTTIDYRVIKAIIGRIINKEHFGLLETLAGRIIEDIFRNTSAESVTINIRKPDIWENGFPGVSITRERIPTYLNLLDFDIDELIEHLAYQGGISFPILPPNRIQELVKEAESLTYTVQPEIIGGGKVREQLSSVTDFSPESLFYRLKDDFSELMVRKFSGSKWQNIFERPLSFNDMCLQKYEPGSIGITPHRDGKSRINIICVFVLKGTSEFAICDDRLGTNPKFLDTKPGNVIILRGPGFFHSTFQPFHFVRNITEERIIFGLRQRINPKKGGNND